MNNSINCDQFKALNINSSQTKRENFDCSRSDLSEDSQNVIIKDQWLVYGRIGEGSFGEVFEIEDINTLKRFAVKREPLKLKHPQIKHESEIYETLAGGPGIPQCHWHGQFDSFDCIVIDLLGPNLNQVKEATQKLTVDIVSQLGIQIITILEHIHNKGLVYRDIKPDNFLFSASCSLPDPTVVDLSNDNEVHHVQYVRPNCDEVFRQWNEPPLLSIVDFGLTTWWRNPTTLQPYPETKRNSKNKTGTARYASLNVHRGKSHSRRDDIESVGYLLLDLIFGTLPWTGIQARNSRAGWDKMKQLKEDIFLSDLCAGLPQGFLSFVEYSRRLKFIEEPNYQLLREFLGGSTHHGKYSTIVKSPFGGHTERRWIMDIEKSSESSAKKNIPIPNHQTNNKNGSSSAISTSYEKLLAKNRKKQKSVGWNSYKHDQAPWVPVTDWDNNKVDTNYNTHLSWGDNKLTGEWKIESSQENWGNLPTDQSWGTKENTTWASTVNKPWD